MLNAARVRELLPGPAGRFLEIGAYDGRTESLTLPLVEAGWGGVMVEANPLAFGRLLANMPDRPDLRLVCAAAVPGPAADLTLPFWLASGSERQDEMSTALPAWRDKPWCAGIRWREVDVGQVTIVGLLARYGRDFDLVVIDAEGLTLELLRAVPWPAMPRVRAIVAEVLPEDPVPEGFELYEYWAPNCAYVRSRP